MRPLFLTILTLLAGNLLRAQSTAVLLKRGDSLISRNEYASASALYESILKKEPANEKAMRGLGYLSLVQDKPEAAEEWYRRALKVNPSCGRCYVSLARVRRMSNDTAGALRMYDSAVAAQPKNGVVLAYRGAGRYDLGMQSTGEADIEKSIVMAPDSGEVQALYAEYLYKRKYAALAYERMGKAIRLAPAEDRAHFFRVRADWYMKESKNAEAAADLDSALRYQPGDATLLRMRGFARTYKEDFSGAMQDFNAAFAHQTPDIAALFTRAMARYGLEDMDGSCDDLNAAMVHPEGASPDQIATMHKMLADHCDSTKAGYYYQRGIAMYNLHNYNSSASWYRRGLQKFPGHLMMQSFLGNTYNAAGKQDSALHFYNLAVNTRPQYEQQMVRDGYELSFAQQGYAPFTASNYLYMAGIYLQLDKPAEGLQRAADGLALLKGIRSDQKKTFYQVRAALFIEANQPDSAIREFTDCIEMDATDYYNYLGRAAAWMEKAAGERITVLVPRKDEQGTPALPLWLPDASAFAQKSGADFGTALADCNFILKTTPDEVYTLLIKAAVLSSSGKPYCKELRAAENEGADVPAMLLEGCGTIRKTRVTNFQIRVNR